MKVTDIAECKRRIKRAKQVAMNYGQIQGDHHRTWVLDQMVRALCGCPYDKPTDYYASCESYERFVQEHNAGDAGPDTYDWDTGIAP